MNYIIAVVVCALLAAADQFTKYLATERIKPLGSAPFIPGFIEFRYHVNEGAAFGIFQGGRWIFVAFTVIVLAAVVYFYIKLPKGKVYSFMRAAMVLVSSGAVGNAIDRARQGFVVDFLNFTFIDFFIFNVADMCLVGGSVLMAVLVIFFYKEKPKDETASN